MKIVITTIDANFVEIYYNDIPAKWKELRIRRDDVRTVALLKDSDFVVIIFSNGGAEELHYLYIENINGVAIESNQQL